MPETRRPGFLHKLRTVIHSPEVLCKFLLVHEAFKRAMFSLRLFCLLTDQVPEMSASTMHQCLNRAYSLDKRGAKLKDGVDREDDCTLEAHFLQDLS